MIVILDYNIGNVGSIANMLKKIGAKAELSSDINAIRMADKLILPGVGAFDAGMKMLKEHGFDEAVMEHVSAGKPLLGICLGMQLLGMGSEEGSMPGLGLIDFVNERFRLPKGSELRIPHMGWDRTRRTQENLLTLGMELPQRYYYVHSYHPVCTKAENVMMQCEYGYEFTAAVCNGNVYGVQFHPEKSHQYGMLLLKNFAENC